VKTRGGDAGRAAVVVDCGVVDWVPVDCVVVDCVVVDCVVVDWVVVDDPPVPWRAAERGAAVRPSGELVPEMTWVGGFWPAFSRAACARFAAVPSP